MAGEPELSEWGNGGTSDEWVRYLQQLLAYRGYWVGEPDGVFEGQLTATLVSVQHHAGIEPADGVVRDATWRYLLTDATPAEAAASSNAGESPLTRTPGVDITVPTFQYNFPELPVAEATQATPVLTCASALTITGSVQISLEQCVPGLTALANDASFQQAAEVALGPLNENIAVGGLGTTQLSFQGGLGTEFVQVSYEFVAPNTLKFQGNIRVDYQVDTFMGPVRVLGTPGFSLAVSCIPHEPPRVEVRDEDTWFEAYATELLVGAGVIVLVGGAILLAPETGGLSLGVLVAI